MGQPARPRERAICSREPRRGAAFPAPAQAARQDFQRAQVSPQLAEAAAYLVGAITRRQYGFNLGAIANPRASGHAYALHLADRMLGQSVAASYLVPDEDARALCALVATGAGERYAFNGI
ncbi:MAG: hypothetical protein IPL88_12325 [Rhizobiales bacterium]|nr:hypothetical protein [Hyphomicrobiales bacterium]